MKTTPDYVEGGTKDPRDTTKARQSKPFLEDKDDAKDEPAGPAP